MRNSRPWEGRPLTPMLLWASHFLSPRGTEHQHCPSSLQYVFFPWCTYMPFSIRCAKVYLITLTVLSTSRSLRSLWVWDRLPKSVIIKRGINTCPLNQGVREEIPAWKESSWRDLYRSSLHTFVCAITFAYNVLFPLALICLICTHPLFLNRDFITSRKLKWLLNQVRCPPCILTESKIYPTKELITLYCNYLFNKYICIPLALNSGRAMAMSAPDGWHIAGAQ